MEYNFNEYVAVQSEIEVLAENKEAMALIKTFDGTAKNSRGAFIAKAVSDLKMNATTAGAYWQRNKKYAIGQDATTLGGHWQKVNQANKDATRAPSMAAMDLLKTFNYKDEGAKAEFISVATSTLNMTNEEASGFWQRNFVVANAKTRPTAAVKDTGPVGKDNLSRAAAAKIKEWTAAGQKFLKLDGVLRQDSDGYMSRDGFGPQGRSYRFGIYNTQKYIMVGVVLFPNERYAYFTDGEGKRSQPEIVTKEFAKELTTKVKNLGDALGMSSASMVTMINNTADKTVDAAVAAKGAAGDIKKFSTQADAVEKAMYELDAIAQRIGPHLMDEHFASSVRYYAAELRKNLAGWKANTQKTK